MVMPMPLMIRALGRTRPTNVLLTSCDDRNTEIGMGRKHSPVRRGAVAQDVLEELPDEEEHPVHAGVRQSPRHIGCGAGPAGEQPQGDDRLLGAGLDAEEHAEQEDACGERARAQRARPAVGARLDQPEDDAGHAERGRERAGDIEVAVATLRLPHRRAPERPNRQSDGYVDEHHPAPGHQLGQGAPGHQADGPTGRRHRGEEADGPDSLGPSEKTVVRRASEEGAASAAPTP